MRKINLGLALSLLALSAPALAQVDIGSIGYSEQQQATSAAPTSVPFLPAWAMVALALLVAGGGVFATRLRSTFSKVLTMASVGIIVAAAVTGLRIEPAHAQNADYTCTPNVSITGAVTIEDAAGGSANFEYDPSAAVAECAETLAGYTGPGTLAVDVTVTFTVTNSSGVALDLEEASFTTDETLTDAGFENFAVGNLSVSYTTLSVDVSNIQSACGATLANGADCEVSVDVDTSGDLAVAQ